MSGVSLKYFGSLACLTLENATKANLLSWELIQQLNSILDNLESRTRALLLRSNGVIFSHGMQLSSSSAVSPLEGSQLYAQLLERLYQLPLVTICAVQGSCKAGGLGLVSVCDFVYATENSSFQLSEALLGLLPANLAPYLLRRIGSQRLLQWVLSLEELSATAAQQCALVDTLGSSKQDLEKKIKALLRNVFRCSPAAIQRMKEFRQQLLDNTWERQKDIASHLLAELWQQSSTRQAISDFNDALLPSWVEKFHPKEALLLGE